jgi:hypothetical protein
MEQLVLRYMKFDIKVDSPHNVAYIMGATLKKQYPAEIGESAKFSIVLGTLLQDASVYPEFIIDNNPICSAVTLISLAMQLSDIKLDDHEWLSKITELISVKELQSLKRRFLQVVYNEKL